MFDDVTPDARQFVFAAGLKDLPACAELHRTAGDALQHVGLGCLSVLPATGSKTVDDGKQGVVVLDAYALPCDSAKWVDKDPSG